jgi:hypothetical protein
LHRQVFAKSIWLFFLSFIFSISGMALSFQSLQEISEKVIPSADEQALSKELIAELEDVHLKEVLLKGFLFKSPKGLWLLSSEPDLKSCCAGSPTKVFKQVFLEGSFQDALINQLVTMRGVFTVDPKRNLNGELIQVYLLKESLLTANEERKVPWTTLGMTILGLLGAFWILWKIKKRHV